MIRNLWLVRPDDRRLWWVTVALTLWAIVAVLGTGQSAGAEEPAKPAVQEANGTAGVRRGPPRPADASGDATTAISRLALPPVRVVMFTEEREAAARAFVRKNRPEMDALLDQLVRSKPAEYQQVICDLFRTSELFAAMRQEDSQRYELALRSWQTEARTHLLAAELAAHPDQAERVKVELRVAVEQLADLQIEQAAYEVRKWEAKVRRAEGQLKQIEGRRNEFVSERLKAILQAVGRVDLGQKEESKPKR